MAKNSENFPQPGDGLEAPAQRDGSHDASDEAERPYWLRPAMITTSLRLPPDVIAALKAQAHSRDVRYTVYVRSILEQVARGEAGAAGSSEPGSGAAPAGVDR